MSKGKEKVIEIDDDELDFLPSLLANYAFDPRIPLEPIRSSVGTSARRMSPQITSSTSNSGDEGSSGSEDTLSVDQGEDSGEMSSPGTSRPDKKSKIGGKKDTPIRPPRGYVTLFLESFKLGMRCCQSEPTIDEVKHLYQLKSSPKDVGWYYFMSSTKTRKPITDLPTGGGGNWKKKFFFAGDPWGQVAQIDGKNYHLVSWSQGVHYQLKPEPLKEVEAVLANSYSGRELLTTYNFFESRLVHTDLKMKDAVIGALTRKRPRAHTAKHDQNKDAPSAKQVNIAEQVPPLRTLPLPPTKAGETTYYKAKVGRYDRMMKEEAKATTLEEELTKVKEDLQRQKATYEAQLESLKDSHQVQVENLEKEADNQYDQGLRHSYRCIMAVLRKQHPNLKMNELAAGVAQYIDEEAAKEDVEELEPNATEEGNSPPRVVHADVSEASTPPGAIGAEKFGFPLPYVLESARLCLVEQVLACLASSLAINRL
ncbi:hypothetical protein CUMW_214210 [Citrus unshiu]|uniref:Uncharacterized protein n=1 Tax=Citrus unshiu TaxID=55188 RepID=A0A2H5QCK3_CITUN|nr:hypothetical protein CUMW_214210 [Citrus unshiu]